jgi:hypothetical protein
MTSNFSDLLLLIGTNPLPNLVVAEYFLNINQNLDRIWLIHSEKNKFQEGTIKEAENLEKTLIDRFKERPPKIKFLSLTNISNAKEIEKDFISKCGNELKNRSVHLNYTGGTKAMGIHIYRTLEKQKDLKEKSFSYLDARNFNIVWDNKDEITDDLRNEMIISFDEIVKLHGFEKKRDECAKFSKAVDAFTSLISRGKLQKYLYDSNGYKRSLFERKASFEITNEVIENFKNKIPDNKLKTLQPLMNKKIFLEELYDSLNKLSFTKEEIDIVANYAERKDNSSKLAISISHLKEDQLKAFKPNKEFLEIISSMPEDYMLFNSNGEFIKPKTSSKCKDAIEFLDGKWLEDYIYKVIEHEIKSKATDIQKNCIIDKEECRFELDVVLVRGYQLIGISCTTANKKDICKNKGFEIILRTRQIGGEEAKAILITCVEDNSAEDIKNKLEEELRADTGSGKNIIVLGINDLEKANLLKQLQEFIGE